MFELAVVAACLLALALLVPLRGLIDSFPLVVFVAALILLGAPGVLLTRWFARGLFPGPALAPAAVAFGIGLYGLPGIPVLLLHLSLGFYLAVCGIVLSLFLVAAAVVARRPEDAAEEESGEAVPGSRLLWVPFLLLGGGLVFLTMVEVPRVDGDTWDYLA